MLTRAFVSSCNLNFSKLISSGGNKWFNVVTNKPAFNNCLAFNQLRHLSLSTQRFSERRFHDKHEWVTLENNVATVGISDFAQKSLGDIVFIELPEVDREVEKDDEVGCVESTKSASDIYSPLSGKIIAVNEHLETQPHLINSSAYDEGWIFKMEVTKEGFDRLMDEKQYETFVKLQSSQDA